MSDGQEGAHESFYRILELALNPIKGRFDATHLKRIHGHIFQDFPEYQPGRYRQIQRERPYYIKSRQLEAAATRHHVHYMPHDFAARIDQTLRDFGGLAGLRGLPLDRAAERLASLYADLDHAHPFAEGNSRTLRAFTAQLARETGFRLDWGAATADALTRDRLYVARDVAVTRRAFPGLDRQRAMRTDSRAEYEAYLHVIARHVDAPTLRDLIRASLRR
jgi:cell filamentation protein